MIPFDDLVTVPTLMEAWPVKDSPSIGMTLSTTGAFVFFTRRLENMSMLPEWGWRLVALGSGLRLTSELKLTV